MVEIIPKKRREKILPRQNVLFYLSLFLLTAAVFSYFILIYFENKASLSLRDLDEKISAIGTDEDKKLEKEILSSDTKIKDFSRLFQEHQKASNFFKFLEEITHPKVRFSSLNLDVGEGQAKVFAQAPDFQTVSQQIFIFQNQPSIKEVNLSELSLGDEGGVNFSISFSLDPQIFK